MLTRKEELEQEAHDQGVLIDYINFKSDLKGLYIDGSIALKSGMSSSEAADILAEEMGHHYTTVGNILNQNTVIARKQERSARLWGYNKRIGLIGLVDAYKHHCQSQYEVAEFLGVSEDTLTEALEHYRQIYGISVKLDNYRIQFEPYLAIMEMFNIKED